jgi:peptidoglycan/xylan/chitin deacetylase (PgdA/CDA1 family)
MMVAQQVISEPTFLLTFDTELLWGVRFMGWSEEDERAAVRTREEVMPAVIEMLDELEIAATFAIVGHLLVQPGELAYPQVNEGTGIAADWYRGAATASQNCPTGFYWPELPAILDGSVIEHEIALHTFTHWHFESPETTEEIAVYEVEMNRRALTEVGLRPSSSMVFPRNNTGCLAALRRAGISAFRGLDPNWYGRLRGGLSSVGHLLDCLLMLPPPVVTELQTYRDVLDVKGSYLLWSSNGFRRWIPQYCRLQEVRKGLNRCLEAPAMFHLWMHPINLAYHPSAMLRTLRSSLEEVARLRQRGALRVVTMSGMGSGRTDANQ